MKRLSWEDAGAIYPSCSADFDRDLGDIFTAPFDLFLLQSNGPIPETLWVIDIETNACAVYRPDLQVWNVPYCTNLDVRHATPCPSQRGTSCNCLRNINRLGVPGVIPWDGRPPVVS